MKLNNRRTILVGLAFLSICTFWQMYDSVMTLILTDTFKLNETFAGAIMAADNVLALFLLPFFGALSDKTSTRIGRRMPFIEGGTALAAILMNLIPLLDDRYAANPSTGTLVLSLGKVPSSTWFWRARRWSAEFAPSSSTTKRSASCPMSSSGV